MPAAQSVPFCKERKLCPKTLMFIHEEPRWPLPPYCLGVFIWGHLSGPMNGRGVINGLVGPGRGTGAAEPGGGCPVSQPPSHSSSQPLPPALSPAPRDSRQSCPKTRGCSGVTGWRGKAGWCWSRGLLQARGVAGAIPTVPAARPQQDTEHGVPLRGTEWDGACRGLALPGWGQ